MKNVYRFRRKRLQQAREHRSLTTRTRIRAALTLLMFASILSVVTVGIVGAVVYRSYADDLKPPEEIIAETSVGPSKAYDRTGIFLYEYVDPHGGLRDPVPLSEISAYLIAATIATEDASFFSNPGVNFKGLLRAAVENLTPFGPGFLEGSGGSSITQQLARNIYIQRDDSGLVPRTVQRKLKETVIALELKRRYDDNQILEWYLNQIFYGKRAFGAEAAARQFFGKRASELTLAEAAYLAGLPQAPGTYQTNPAAAKARQIEVLDLMLKHLDEIREVVDVTPEEIEAAKQAPLNFVETQVEIKGEHFVFLVEDQVKKMCSAGLFEPPNKIPCDKVVTQGGLRITTTLDIGLTELAKQIVDEEISRNEERYGGHNGSLVAIRPSTGEILAYVGSRNYWREDIDGQVDIATSLQSHGSSMKVFTYLTAFEQGWVPSTIVRDEPLFLETGAGKKQVNNWNFSHLGNITVRRALAESVNTAAVRTVMEVGVDEMRATAHKMGITDLRRGDCGPTITLGACEVKLLDMTFAFAVLANNGVMKGRPTSEDLPDGFRELDPVSVLKIEDASGNVIYQFSAPEERQVVDPAYAYMVTDILSKDAINWSRLTIDREAASKTGTSDEFRDGVVLGYSPDLSVGVWMGNADNTPMAPGTFSSAGTGPMWKRFMTEAHAYLKIAPRSFEEPDSIVRVRCAGRQEVFKKGETPSKPGACRAPNPQNPGITPSPTPKPPVFPVRGATPTPTPSPTPAPAPPGPPGPISTPVLFFYTVREGDTLESIADRFSVPLEILLAINDFSSDEIVQPGMTVKVPLLDWENEGQPQGQGPSTDGGEGDRGGGPGRGPPER